MSIASDCGACLSGNHEQHDRNHGIRRGVIGGTYCGCSGDCRQRFEARGRELADLLSRPMSATPISREQIMAETLWLHDLRHGTDHCDRKYVEVCSKYQEYIFEAGTRLRSGEATR